MPTVLVILAEGFEEIEAITPVDVLRRAGARVTVAAIADGIHATGRNGVTIHADTPLAAAENQEFDCLLLPGGPAVDSLRGDPRVRSLIVRQNASGRWLAAICAAPVLLHEAGVLKGRRYTAHASVAAELPDLEAAARTVVDGHVITSRGAGTALDFGLLLVEKLFSPEKADEIGRSICA